MSNLSQSPSSHNSTGRNWHLESTSSAVFDQVCGWVQANWPNDGCGRYKAGANVWRKSGRIRFSVVEDSLIYGRSYLNLEAKVRGDRVDFSDLAGLFTAEAGR